MRILKQISLDSAMRRNTLSPSSSSKFSFDFQQDRLNETFVRRLFDTIAQTSAFLSTSADYNEAKPEQIKKNGKNAPTLINILDELNSLIVFLIQLSGSNFTAEVTKEKKRSKVRRQYSAFVGTGLNRKSSIGNNNNLEELESPTSPTACGPTSATSGNGCSLEEAVNGLINSQLIYKLLRVMPDIGFEEKKLVRIIVTNSMIIQVDKAHPVIDHFCHASSGILQLLISTYEIGRSDVTLNCGRIIRFASQYEVIVTALLSSDYFFNFFEYMRRSPAEYPFDVAMDLFYTFKVLLTKSKKATCQVLEPKCDAFLTAFILLLAHAEATENYVTKRQLMEIFTEMFTGKECTSLRERFIIKDEYIFPIFAYLWNRNIQIRLRCLALVNQLFRYYCPQDDASSASNENNNESTMDKEERSTLESPTSPTSPKAKVSFSLNSLKRRILTPRSSLDTIESFEWKLDQLVDSLAAFQLVYYAHQTNTNGKKEVKSEQIYDQMVDMLNELKVECNASNLAQFSSQTAFINQILDCLRCNGREIIAARSLQQ